MTFDVLEDAAGLLRRRGKIVRPQEPETPRAIFFGQGAGGLEGFAQIGIHDSDYYTRASVARQCAAQRFGRDRIVDRYERYFLEVLGR
ncbi:MAG TPA: hypothetical protein VN317_10445 [Candidatus Methanoperedens sp.]|nr:hypothetical protein [Candidatus Methanoperedens sp.]